MESNTETVGILNDLIEINNDRIKGFENALKDVEQEPELKSIFAEKITESQRFRSELSAEVQVLGADADTGNSISGTIHRTWLDIRAKFTGGSEKVSWKTLSLARMLYLKLTTRPWPKNICLLTCATY